MREPDSISNYIVANTMGLHFCSALIYTIKKNTYTEIRLYALQ